MENSLVVAVLAGLGGMFGWGVAEFATKKSVDRIGSVSSLVWAHVLGTAVLLVFLLLSYFGFHHVISVPTTGGQWLGLAFFGTLQTIVYFYAYRGFEHGQVAVLSPIFASFAGIVALISVTFLGERFNLGLVPALAAIFCGILLLNLDVKAFQGRRLRVVGAPGVRDIAIATVLATGWTLGWARFVGNQDELTYTLLMFFFMTMSAYLVARVQKVKLSGVARDIWPFLWLIGAGEAIAYFAVSVGYANTSRTSVIALLSGASSLPTIILARIFLKEKLNRMQMIGSLTIVFGIALLYLLK